MGATISGSGSPNLSLALNVFSKMAAVMRSRIFRRMLALSATTAMAGGGANMPLCWPPTSAGQ